MAATMVPPRQALPDVLPTDRLSATSSPAVTMRDTATRVVPSAMPKSSPVRTRIRAGRRGGSMPSNVDAITDRAV